MKRTIVSALAFILCSCLHAQPVLTREHLMIPGDIYASATATVVPDPGPAGAGVVWDFSAVGSGDPAVFQVQDPGMTPYAGSFPDANIAFVAPAQLYQYQLINTGGFAEHGYVVPNFSTLTYNNPKLTLQFPLAYQGQWGDDYTYTIDFQTNPPISTFGEGMLDGSVDAYGSVILPQAAFDDVLRIQIIGASTDTTVLGNNLYERNYFNDTTYIWLSASYHAPLCTYTSGSMVRYTTLIQGGDTLVIEETDAFVSFSIDPGAQPEPSSVRNVQPGLLALTASPNPFIETVDFVFQSAGAQEMLLDVYDVDGVLIESRTLLASEGRNTVTCEFSHVLPGVYFAMLKSPDGADVVKLLCLTQIMH